MKRRDFLRSAAATAALPMMPLSMAAAPVAAPPPNAMQVGWAALYARANNQATPALLQKWLRVGPDQAQALMSELVSKNIVHTPIAGSAAAVKPMYPSHGLNSMFGRGKTIGRNAKDMLDALSEEAPDEVPTPHVEAQEPETEPQTEEVPHETA